jgi:hypothetical protein
MNTSFEYFTENTEKRIPIGKIKNIFDDDILKKSRLICEEYLNSKELEYDNHTFFRKYIHNPKFFTEIHKSLEGLASDFFKRPVKKSYCFLSIYEEGGFCPAHYDRIQCEYTLDVALNFKINKPWPIYIKNKPYDLKVNESICYSGTNHFHYRKRKLEKDEYYYLIFFHFVDKTFMGVLD